MRFRSVSFSGASHTRCLSVIERRLDGSERVILKMRGIYRRYTRAHERTFLARNLKLNFSGDRFMEGNTIH